MKCRALTFHNWLFENNRGRNYVLKQLGINIGSDETLEHWNIIVRGTANSNPFTPISVDDFNILMEDTYKLSESMPSFFEKYNLHTSQRSFRVSFALKKDANLVYDFIMTRIDELFGGTDGFVFNFDHIDDRKLNDKLIDVLYQNMSKSLEPGEADGMIAIDTLI